MQKCTEFQQIQTKKKEVKTKYGQVKTGNAKTWDDTQEKKAGYTTK